MQISCRLLQPAPGSRVRETKSRDFLFIPGRNERLPLPCTEFRIGEHRHQWLTPWVLHCHPGTTPTQAAIPRTTHFLAPIDPHHQEVQSFFLSIGKSLPKQRLLPKLQTNQPADARPIHKESRPNKLGYVLQLYGFGFGFLLALREAAELRPKFARLSMKAGRQKPEIEVPRYKAAAPFRNAPFSEN